MKDMKLATFALWLALVPVSLLAQQAEPVTDDPVWYKLYVKDGSELYETFDFKSCTGEKKEDWVTESTDVLLAIQVRKCDVGGKKVATVMHWGKPLFVEIDPDAIAKSETETFSIEELSEQLANAGKAERAAIEKQASQMTAYVRADELKEEFAAYIPLGIAINEARPTEDHSMTGAKFRIFNPAKKTIKYLTFNFSGLDRANKPVPAMNGKMATSLRANGPLAQYENDTWEFNKVWPTDAVDTLKLSTIDVEYMDDTKRTIKVTDNHFLDEATVDEFEEMKFILRDAE